MRVFVTGASGWVGSAVVSGLLSAGHSVVGLARSERSASVVASLGAQVRRGSLDDLDSLRSGAASAEGVLHLAFDHDVAFSGGFDSASRAERRAIETLGAALEGSGRPLVVASVTGGLPSGRVGYEQDAPDPAHPLAVRFRNEQVATSLRERGVGACVVRLPPTVHGPGDPSPFLRTLIDHARSSGFSGYIGDGRNRWPAVHRLDAAALFQLALERAPAGAILHAIDDEGVTTREIAETIGRGLKVPAVSIAEDDAHDHFGVVTHVYASDIPASSAATRELLGWQPREAGLLADLAQDHYYADATPPTQKHEHLNELEFNVCVIDGDPADHE